ncbi:hypothetical protein D3C87_1933510 [compost metagenome]
MARLQRQGRLRQCRAVEAGLTVNIGRYLNLPHQRARAACGKGNAGDIGDTRDGQRVAGDLIQRLVADHGGDRQQFDLRVAPGQQQGNGVVMPRVAIQYDFFHFYS